MEEKKFKPKKEKIADKTFLAGKKETKTTHN